MSNKTGGRFLLGSERETVVRSDRQVALQELQARNKACEHVVVLGAPGLSPREADSPAHPVAAQLAIKMRGPDMCPHCTRREAAYWRLRCKSAEGVATALQHEQAAERESKVPPPVESSA